jgi:hypothetical protein
VALNMAERSRWGGICSLLRNILIAGLLYALVFGIGALIKSPLNKAKGKLGIPALLDKTGPTKVVSSSVNVVKVKFASTSKTVTMNPYANVFNRPFSAVKSKDGYLGPRPHVDTEADFDVLIEECRGTPKKTEKIRNVFDCLAFLSEGEKHYYRVPAEGLRASAQNPQEAEYADADGHGNTLDKYPKGRPSSKESPGVCNGPIIPYHTYWTGRGTWRVEIFIKSYLFTQNLACSRLWIWLDTDRYPNAMTWMLEKDPLFARFLPFVERGDIVLKSWKFPERIPLPSGEDNTDGIGYYKTPSKPNTKGEVFIADNIVKDGSGQEMLVLSQKQLTLLPVAVSDTVRFVVLHLHGGVFLDMDVLMLRDLRPLLLPKQHSFAERWAAYPHSGDYNNAVMSLTANSSLSSYLLRGGVRMGMNYHPRVIGRMAWKDGRDKELLMLESAAFDPVWPEYTWDREGRCTVPCLRDYSAAFKGKAGVIKDEWESYDGKELERIDLTKAKVPQELKLRSIDDIDPADIFASRVSEALRRQQQESIPPSSTAQAPAGETPESFSTTSGEEQELRKEGAIKEYRPDVDKYPPNNRTMENFFRGAWTYHIYDQVSTFYSQDNMLLPKKIATNIRSVVQTSRALILAICN